MTISAIKKELHQFIEEADEKKLKAIHLLLENELHSQNYSDKDLKKIYSVLNGYETGAAETLPAEVAHPELRAKIAAM